MYRRLSYQLAELEISENCWKMWRVWFGELNDVVLHHFPLSLSCTVVVQSQVSRKRYGAAPLLTFFLPFQPAPKREYCTHRNVVFPEVRET